MSNTVRGKAKPALVAEAKSVEDVLPESLEVEFDGVTYQINPRMLDDIDVVEAIEENRSVKAVKAFLGVRQWAAFKQTHTSYSNDLIEILNEILQAINGVTVGESKG